MRILNFLIVPFILLSFSLSKVQPEKFITEFNKKSDKLHFTIKTKNDVLYEFFLIPDELRTISDYKKGLINAKEVSSRLNYSDEFSILLKLHVPSLVKQEFLKKDNPNYSYDERLEYYAFEFQKHIQVMNDKEENLLQNFIFERDFGLKTYGTFILRVKKTKGTSIHLKWEDHVYGQEKLELEIDLRTFHELPQLKKINKWKIPE